jgi:FkbM family methyltransferase
MSVCEKPAVVSEGLGTNAWTAKPLRSVLLGRRVASAHWPRQLQWVQTASKKLAWTAVEARQVDTPVRYALRELTSHRQGVYSLRDGSSRFVVRHRSGDVEIFRKFYGYGYYNLPAEIVSGLRSLGRPVNVLDLGANIGFFEIFTRDRLPISRVVCIEPDPYNGAVLDQARAANGADWEIVAACAANEHGTATFSTGHKNLSRIASSGDATIPTVDVFPYIADADLVKMNIEGSEWEILKDPRFASTSVSWMVEYHHIASPEADIHGLVKRLFADAGYTVRIASQSADRNGLLWAWKA